MDSEDFSAFKKQLGRTLQARRKQCDLSQEKAGEAIGLDRVSIGYIEQGKRAPKLSTLLALSRLYNISLSELFSFDETK